MITVRKETKINARQKQWPLQFEKHVTVYVLSKCKNEMQQCHELFIEDEALEAMQFHIVET